MRLLIVGAYIFCRRLFFFSLEYGPAGVWSTSYGTSCSLQHIVLLCAELQDSMLIIRAPGPPESWARRKHALLQVRRTALLYLFTIAGPCRWLAPRPGLPRPGPITACIHAHFYLGHSLLPHLSGLVLTMYDRIPLT